MIFRRLPGRRAERARTSQFPNFVLNYAKLKQAEAAANTVERPLSLGFRQNRCYHCPSMLCSVAALTALMSAPTSVPSLAPPFSGPEASAHAVVEFAP